MQQNPGREKTWASVHQKFTQFFTTFFTRFFTTIISHPQAAVAPKFPHTFTQPNSTRYFLSRPGATLRGVVPGQSWPGPKMFPVKEHSDESRYSATPMKHCLVIHSFYSDAHCSLSQRIQLCHTFWPIGLCQDHRQAILEL